MSTPKQVLEPRTSTKKSPKTWHETTSLCSIVGGVKGGVGKSLFARLLIELYHQCGRKPALVDFDQAMKDVAKFYTTETVFQYRGQLSAVEGEQHLADIWLPATVRHGHTVLNLPANVSREVHSVFIRDEGYLIAKEEDVSLRYWFISNGSIESIHAFEETAQRLAPYIRMVFVKNLFFATPNEWQSIEQFDCYQQTMEKYQIPSIELPRLDPYLRNVCNELSIPFRVAANDWRDSPISQVWDQSKAQRVKIFARNAFAEIERGISDAEL